MPTTDSPPSPAIPPQGIPLTARERFRRAARCLSVDRPPVWLMRQAGRALPEYRKLKETYTFVQLVQNPELAVEVTLQPIRRFGFDAAILFSDILVIPEALGQTYHFRETGGVQMDFAVKSAADIAKLSVEQVCERLHYVDKALRMLRKELGDQTALLGFSGSPWTLATFMMEGASVPKYSRALALFQEDRPLYYALAEKLTTAVTAYLRMQIAAGIDGLQIFDSHGGHLPPEDFQEASGRWMKDIVTELRSPKSELRRINWQLAIGNRQSPSSSSASAPTPTGPTSSPSAPTSSAWIGKALSPTSASAFPRPSLCKVIFALPCSPIPRPKSSPPRPAACWTKCAVAPATSSTSATA